jgi:hypothetical protein
MLFIYLSIKARNIQRDKRVNICAGIQTPLLLSSITVYGTAKISHHKQNELFERAIEIAERYKGSVLQKKF